MSAALQPVTLKEFLSRPERPDAQREELIEGEILLSPEPKSLHADIIRKLREQLMPLEQQGLIIQQGFGVILPPNSLPGPDLAAIDRSTWLNALHDDVYPVGSPALVVEVRSPSNRQLGRKASLYLEHGAEAVWWFIQKGGRLLSMIKRACAKYGKTKRLFFAASPLLSHNSLRFDASADGTRLNRAYNGSVRHDARSSESPVRCHRARRKRVDGFRANSCCLPLVRRFARLAHAGGS